MWLCRLWPDRPPGATGERGYSNLVRQPDPLDHLDEPAIAGLCLTSCAGANGCSDVVGDNRGPPFAIVDRPGVFLHRADNIHPVACTQVLGGNALGQFANEAGNAKHRQVDRLPSPLNSEVLDRITSVMKGPTATMPRVLEASTDDLVRTAYFGRKVLAELGAMFEIQWHDDEYLDVLGALLGPLICSIFSKPDGQITAIIPSALLPSWLEEGDPTA